MGIALVDSSLIVVDFHANFCLSGDTVSTTTTFFFYMEFLFCQELERFLKKSVKAAKGEAQEAEEDFEKNKLAEDNIGFQMLKKAGWKEGEGLGKEGEGAAAPVNINAGAEGAGVGVKETHEVAEGDNEFEQYRKRMMLAYRFRPNPLNNPRRSYY